jgi:quinol monooxygenase YgiN
VSQLEMIAHLKIRPGQLKGFKAQAAELIRLTREQDTQTLRYDWFINEDAMECEVHELYQSEQGLIEHNLHVMEARAVLFRDYAYDHRMSSYGEISPELRALGQKHAGGIREFSLFQGLQPSPAPS